MIRDQSDEDPMVVISHLYPVLYSTPQPQATTVQQGEAKPRRRRRRKAKSNDGGEAKKRKLSEEQVNMLERSFGCEHKLESDRKDKLASELGLDPRQVAVWFQNRRARWKNKKLEEEYSKLRAAHESTVIQKCNLETEILKLKEQLEEAQKEITRLWERSSEITSSNSPSSSMTMDAKDPSILLGEYNFGNFNDPFYLQGDSYIPVYGWDIYDI